jgi:hypothetical protein
MRGRIPGGVGYLGVGSPIPYLRTTRAPVNSHEGRLRGRSWYLWTRTWLVGSAETRIRGSVVAALCHARKVGEMGGELVVQCAWAHVTASKRWHAK